MLQSTGKSFYTMITQGTGAIVNILLDPILIHGWLGMPAMGVAGAAVATVIGQWASALLALYFNEKHNPDVQFGRRYVIPQWKTIAAILTVGIPSIIMNGIGSFMNFSMNQILQGFSETATSVFGIYFKIQSFFFMPLFGINNATISIIAFNFGARKPERIVKTLKIGVCAALVLMFTGLAVFQLAPDLLLGLFNPSEEFLVIGRAALRTISWSFPIAAVYISLSACFQALGNGIYSTITSICRQMLVLLPVAYLLSLTGDVNKVAPIDKSSTMLSVFLAIILFGETNNLPVKLGCTALIGAGTYLMIEKKEHTAQHNGRSWLYYAAASALFAALTSVLAKVGVSGVEANLATAIRTGVILVMSWGIVFAKGEQHSLKAIDKKELLFIGLSGLGTGASWLCYYYAIQNGDLSIVVPIDKMSILLTVLFSRIFLKERLTRKAALGLAMMCIGTLMMALWT